MERNDISWNENKEVIYKGEKLSSSNIIHLLKHTMKKNSESKPIGMKSFYKLLSTLKIPKGLIKNRKGLDIINKIKNKEDKNWRPPGELIKKTKRKWL